MGIDYQVVQIDMKSPEAVVKNEDGSYTIFINSRLSVESQRKSFFHAMFHIFNSDMDNKSEKTADMLEINAHNVLDNIFNERG